MEHGLLQGFKWRRGGGRASNCGSRKWLLLMLLQLLLLLLSGLEARGDLGVVVAGVVEIDKGGVLHGVYEAKGIGETETADGDPDDAGLFVATLDADLLTSIEGGEDKNTGIAVNFPILTQAISLVLTLAFAFSSLYASSLPYPNSITRISR